MIGDEGLKFLIKSLDQIKGLGLRRCDLGAESVRLISERLVETQHKVSLLFNKKFLLFNKKFFLLFNKKFIVQQKIFFILSVTETAINIVSCFSYLITNFPRLLSSHQHAGCHLERSHL